jgi:hypothetical protein
VFERRSPWKLTVGLPGSSDGGSLGGPSFGRKLLRLARGFDQRPVNREVLVAQQTQACRLAHDFIEKPLGNLVLEQPPVDAVMRDEQPIGSDECLMSTRWYGLR